jgi:hypothetical protein
MDQKLEDAGETGVPNNLVYKRKQNGKKEDCKHHGKRWNPLTLKVG